MSRREDNKLREVRRGYRHHFKKKWNSKTHKRNPWKGIISSVSTERALSERKCVVMRERYWVRRFRWCFSGWRHFKKVWFSFHRWGIWDLKRSRIVSASHLVSGEAKIQTQISLMINSSGACGLQKIGNHLGPRGFWWVTDSEQDGDGWGWMWSPQWAEGHGLISYFSSPTPSPQFQTRDLSYQVRQSWKELLGT